MNTSISLANWLKIEELVKEYGYGCLSFENSDDESFEVEDVYFIDEEGRILVLLS